MSRRKTQISGRSNPSWLAEALGFWTHETINDLLEGIDFPELDIGKIEKRTNRSITNECAQYIHSAYKNYVFSIYSEIIDSRSKIDDSVPPQTPFAIDHKVFQDLISKVEKKSNELIDLIDELAEFQSGLLIRPENNRELDDFPSPRITTIIQRLTGCAPAVYTVDMQGFSDYFAFRRQLDYFSNFEKLNKRFNNFYSLRYSTETGHTNYERFIRHVVVDLIRDKFPATITIPTDTNPDYESPLIAALLEIQDQHNSKISDLVKPNYELKQNMSYRQFAHLVGTIIADLQNMEEILSNMRFHLP